MRSEEKIRQALDVLYQEGLAYYKPEYRQSANKYDAIGLAISGIESYPLNFVRLAYAPLEDHNHHSACAVLDWIFPQLNPGKEYLSTLQRIERIIGDRTVEVCTTWNDEKMDYDTAKYRVRLVVEKIEE